MDDGVAEGLNNDRWSTLMRASLAGDDIAYRTLLDELARAFRITVANALRRAGRGNADIEDVIQETLLAVHLKRHTWDSTRPFGPWVRAVSHYKLVDALRRQGFRVEVSVDEISETLAGEAGPDTDIEDAMRLIDKLASRDKSIVRAISIDGRSIADVGKELDLSEGAVRVALHRALKQLAALYRSNDR